MDAFEVFGFDAVTADIGMGIAFQSDGSDEVLDKDRVVVCAFSDVFFVGPFEEGVDFRAGAGFDEGDEIFDPNGFTERDFEPDLAALVVGAAFTDGLTAGAEGGDGDGNSELEAEILSVEGGVEAGLIIDEAGGGGDGGFFLDEIREIEFEVGGVGLESFLKGAEDRGNAFDMDETAVFLEDFDEAAHVGALKVVGKIDGEGDGGDGVLSGVGAVADDYGVAKSFDADLIDPEIAEVRGGLGVVQGTGLGGYLFQTEFMLTRSTLLAKRKVLPEVNESKRGSSCLAVG